MNTKYKTSATTELPDKGSKVALSAAAVSAFIFASAMVLAPSSVSADTQENAAGPLTVTQGTGFPTEDTLKWQAEGRLGNSAGTTPLTGDWELGVGTNTQSPDTSSMEQFDWQSNKTEDFTVEYDGTSTATLTVGGTSTEFEVGEVNDTADLYIFGKRSPGFVVVNNLALNGEEIDGSISPGSTDTDGDHLKIGGANLSEGFTLTGQARFTFASIPSIAPSGSAIAFQVQVRGDETAATPEDTTGPVIENFSIENISTLSGNVDVTADVTDESDVEKVKLEVLVIDGFASVPTGIEKELTLTSGSTYATSFDTNELEEGKTYTANLIATDASTGMNESREVSTFYVENDDDNGNGEDDTTPPVIEDEFDVNLAVGKKLNLKPQVSGDENGEYKWTVSNNNLLKRNTPLDKKSLKLQPSAQGDFTATLKVTDEAGNEEEATYNITVTGKNGNDNGNGGGYFNRIFFNIRGNIENFFVNIFGSLKFWN